MNSRHVVQLFMTTLLVGGLTGGIVGMIIRWDEFMSYVTSFELLAMITTFMWLFGVGLIFSVISQAGFFAYLTVHRFGLAICKSVFLWNMVQIVLILFIVFDFIYLRYLTFESGEGVVSYIVQAMVLVIIGLIISFLKVKQTNNQAFIPALFFMIVVTILEWTPVLRENDTSWLYFMLVPLLVCNAYQLFMLHIFIERSQQEGANKRRSGSIVDKQ